MITRDGLLSLNKRRYKVVNVLGHDVRIRSLTERERAEYAVAGLNAAGELVPSKLAKLPRLLICKCVCDENGNAILKDSDVDAMAELDGLVVKQLYAACQEHCGLLDDAKAVEADAKN
jgi:hypothetical protein